MSEQQTRMIVDSITGEPIWMKVEWCGCSDDWKVVKADHEPTDFDDGVFAHGFDSVAEAEAYIRDFDPENPPQWKVTYTNDDPFDLLVARARRRSSGAGRLGAEALVAVTQN